MIINNSKIHIQNPQNVNIANNQLNNFIRHNKKENTPSSLETSVKVTISQPGLKFNYKSLLLNNDHLSRNPITLNDVYKNYAKLKTDALSNPDSMSQLNDAYDETVQILMNKANKYLGYILENDNDASNSFDIEAFIDDYQKVASQLKESGNVDPNTLKSVTSFDDFKTLDSIAMESEQILRNMLLGTSFFATTHISEYAYEETPRVNGRNALSMLADNEDALKALIEKLENSTLDGSVKESLIDGLAQIRKDNDKIVEYSSQLDSMNEKYAQYEERINTFRVMLDALQLQLEELQEADEKDIKAITSVLQRIKDINSEIIQLKAKQQGLEKKSGKIKKQLKPFSEKLKKITSS